MRRKMPEFTGRRWKMMMGATLLLATLSGDGDPSDRVWQVVLFLVLLGAGLLVVLVMFGQDSAAFSDPTQRPKRITLPDSFSAENELQRREQSSALPDRRQLQD